MKSFSKHLLESIGSEKFKVIPVDPDWDHEEITQVLQAFKTSNIRISRDKDITAALVDQNGDIVGGLASDWFTRDDLSHLEKEVVAFQFDIAVMPGNRGGGLKLIDYALNEFETERRTMEEIFGADYSMIYLWVINSRLHKILVDKYGFTEEGSEHLSKW